MDKTFLIASFLLAIFLYSCNSKNEIPNINDNEIQNVNIELSLDSIVKIGNSRVNTISSVYLLSVNNNDLLEISLVNNTINICISIDKNNIYVSHNGKTLKANGDEFILSTVPNINYQLNKSTKITPNGKLTYDTGKDILVSNAIKFTKKNGNIFLNGKKIGGRKITITMNRLSFRLSTTVFVCDMSEPFIHRFDANEFKKSGLGDINEWECQFFISNVPIKYDLVNFNLNNGNDILSLSSKLNVKETYKKFIIQLFPPINLGSYLGIGNSVDNIDIMPFNTNGCRLCYSFYHNGLSNTLEIPLDGKNNDGSSFKYPKIDFKSNEDWNINVIFDKNDFIKHMSDAKSRGNIVDIPYKLIINKK